MKRLHGLLSIGSSDIIGTGISATFWLFLATLIEPDAYGNLFYFMSIAGLASIVSPIATQFVITVYSARQYTVRTTLYTLSIVSTFIGMTVIYFVTHRIDVSLLILGYVAFNLASGKLLGERKLKKYAAINFIQKGLTPLLGISFYFIFGMDAILIALSLTYIPHIIIMIKEIKFRDFQFNEIKLRFKFIIFNYGNNISGLLGGQIDKILIASLFGFALLGNYSLALQITVGMMAIPSVISKYLLTEELHGETDRRFKKKIVIFCSIIAVIGFFVVPEILPKIFPKYLEVSDAVRIMSLAILPASYVQIQIVRFLSQERSHIIFGGSTIYCVVLLVGIVSLTGTWGIIGIAVAYLLATISQISGHTILNYKFR